MFVKRKDPIAVKDGGGWRFADDRYYLYRTTLATEFPDRVDSAELFRAICERRCIDDPGEVLAAFYVHLAEPTCCICAASATLAVPSASGEMVGVCCGLHAETLAVRTARGADPATGRRPTSFYRKRSAPAGKRDIRLYRWILPGGAVVGHEEFIALPDGGSGAALWRAAGRWPAGVRGDVLRACYEQMAAPARAAMPTITPRHGKRAAIEQLNRDLAPECVTPSRSTLCPERTCRRCDNERTVNRGARKLKTPKSTGPGMADLSPFHNPLWPLVGVDRAAPVIDRPDDERSGPPTVRCDQIDQAARAAYIRAQLAERAPAPVEPGFGHEFDDEVEW